MTPSHPSPPAPHRTHSAPRVAQRTSAVALLVLGLLVGVLPTVAGSEPLGGAVSTPGESVGEGAVDDAESELEGSRSRRNEVAAELDHLLRSGVDLEARLVELEAGVGAQQALVSETRAAAEAAAAELERVEQRVAEAEAEVEVRQHRLEQRAVAAYVDAGSAGLDAFYGSTDYNEYHERVLLVRQVADHDQRVLDAVVQAKAHLDEEVAAASAARVESEQRVAEAAVALAELEQNLAEQVLLREAVDMQIAAYRSEVDALAAEEDALLTLIAERASKPEAPPTTEAPATTAPPTTPTTQAPSTTTAPPGSVPATSTSTPAPTTSAPSAPSTSTPPPVVPGVPAMQWPHGGVVTSPFGYRWGRMHQGIDIAAWTGDPVRAAAGGSVIFSGWLGGCGYTVVVDHGSGVVTRYCHFSATSVSEGQTVSGGQTVGLAGSTGNSTGPHLHFEVIVGGVWHDPMKFLP